MRWSTSEHATEPFIHVFLDGDLVGYVKDFDTDEGWIDYINEDCSVTRRHGVVTWNRFDP